MQELLKKSGKQVAQKSEGKGIELLLQTQIF